MKIFVLLSRFPYPLDKGDKLRAYYQIKELSAFHEIHLCCLDDNNIPGEHLKQLESFCKSVTVIKLRKWQIALNLFIGLFSSLPFQVWYFYQGHAHRKIKQQIKNIQPDHIYCQLLRTSEYVKHEHAIPKTLDYMDTFSKGMERRIEHSGWKKPFIKAEFQRLKKYENLIFEYFENKTIISKQDQEFIFHPNRAKIAVIPNGIDLSKFTPLQIDKQYDLVFVGNMRYAPNIESALFIVNEILPLLLKEKPDITILLSGSSPTKAVLELASKNVTVSGWIDDIRESYAKGRIFFAPLNIGTGLQNKLLEAMAMGIPCVTSSLANNALKASDKKEILIGSTPEAYKLLILNLLSDPEKSNSIAAAGKKYVENTFNWTGSTQKLMQLIENKK